MPLEIHGIDVNAKSIEFARLRAEAAGAAVTFECRNALAEELPAGFDVVVSSLFLHHLTDDNAVLLLSRMNAAARCCAMVNDLRRCEQGLALAYVFGRLLSRSSVVHRDAVQSVRAAFTIDELWQLSEQAGLPPHKISRQWPARMLLVWYRPKWSAERELNSRLADREVLGLT
jgi:2-polyprenyl-3-methyl-5-hydroxy-6-metoxy-1,4-benzoquinol methylase